MFARMCELHRKHCATIGYGLMPLSSGTGHERAKEARPVFYWQRMW